MTQPTTVDMTFDTSLIDVSQNKHRFPPTLQQSFSTADSEATIPDDVAEDQSQNQETPKQSQNISSQPTNPTLTPGEVLKSSTPVQHLPTQDTYNAWASVYDTDGNILQAIDDDELQTFLPEFLELIVRDYQEKQLLSQSGSPDTGITIIDLGCGTGRNTAKLLGKNVWPSALPEGSVQIFGLDFSRGMLDVAEQKLCSLPKNPSISSFELHCTNCFPTFTSPSPNPSSFSGSVSASTSPISPRPVSSTFPTTILANAIMSTLVVEHIPLQPFFSTLTSLSAPGAYALITNMHHEMGQVSQAGFVAPDGTKIRGTSFVHKLEEVVGCAEKEGWEVLATRERSVESGDLEGGVVGKRGRKWLGKRVWFGLVLRRGE